MNADVQLRSTEQPHNDLWPVWQWWITMIGVSTIASIITISRRSDLPDGTQLVTNGEFGWLRTSRIK